MPGVGPEKEPRTTNGETPENLVGVKCVALAPGIHSLALLLCFLSSMSCFKTQIVFIHCEMLFLNNLGHFLVYSGHVDGINMLYI